MCHPDDQEYMPMDKTWGIMPPSGMYLPVLGLYLLLLISSNILTVFVSSLGSSISHP